MPKTLEPGAEPDAEPDAEPAAEPDVEVVEVAPEGETGEADYEVEMEGDGDMGEVT